MKSLVRLHSKGDSLLSAQRELQKKSLKACCSQITRCPLSAPAEKRRAPAIIASIGGLLLLVAFTILGLDPLKLIGRAKLSLYDGSFMDGIWRRPPVDVYVKIYLFNLTNPEQFLAGEEKMRVEELGPFVYKEVLENSEVVYNSNGTVTYIPKRTVTYVAQMSTELSLDTIVTVPNVPLIAFASLLANSPMLPNLALRSLTSYLGSQPVVQVSVSDLLWGYDEPLVRLASHIAPRWIAFDKFGLLDRLFDDGVNVVTMGSDNEARQRTNEAGKPVNPLTIDQYNGSPGLAHWGYEGADNATHKECNTLQGLATEGTVFHRNIAPNDTFMIYRKVFCRTLKLQFHESGVSKQGLPEFRYRLPKHVFDNQHPENTCYCPEQKSCLPQGLSDLTPCYYNFPAAVSLPHFLDAEPGLLQALEGLNPDRRQHETMVAIQPDFGIPLEVHSRMQINIVVKKTKFNPLVAPFNDLVVPIFWVDLSMNELPASLSSLLHLLVHVAPALQQVAMVGAGVLGLVLLCTAARSLTCAGRRGGDYSAVARRGPKKDPTPAAGLQSFKCSEIT